MSESDDVLTLPVEGDGAPGERDGAGVRRDAPGTPPGAATHAAGALPGTELVSLSAEARLATALLLQAQALEGMRHAQSDLLRRLEDGSGGAARRAVEELQDNLREIQQAQQQTLSQLARARRRASHRVGLAAAGVVLALAGGLWCVHLWNRDLAGAVEGTRVRIDDAVESRDEDRAKLEASLAGVLQASGAEQARSVKELADALRATEVELRGQLERAQHERDTALASLAASEKSAATLDADLTATRHSQDQLAAELDRTRDERNQHLGENVRLRGQVLDAERRLTELTQSIASLTAAQATRAQAPDGSIVTVQADPETLAARVSRALAASGAGLAQVLEVDAVRDGALSGLLVMLAGEASVTPRVLAAAHGSLLAVEGRAVLRLSEVRERDRQEVLSSVDIELPDLDPEAWRALGVTPPAGFTPVPQVAAALDALLAPHGYTVVGLGSFDGVTLGDVVLRQEDSQGVVLRTLKAARAEVLPVGPELVLQAGTITIAGDERPFFQDECRVPLPGCDFGQWLAAIASPSP